MPRYRNDGSMPLNYDCGPWVEPGGVFDTADYPAIDAAQIESHLRSGFISEVAGFDALHETLRALEPAAVEALDHQRFVEKK